MWYIHRVFLVMYIHIFYRCRNGISLTWENYVKWNQIYTMQVSIVKICNVILRNGKMRRSKYFAVIALCTITKHIVTKLQIVKRRTNIPIVFWLLYKRNKDLHEKIFQNLYFLIYINISRNAIFFCRLYYFFKIQIIEQE